MAHVNSKTKAAQHIEKLVFQKELCKTWKLDFNTLLLAVYCKQTLDYIPGQRINGKTYSCAKNHLNGWY